MKIQLPAPLSLRRGVDPKVGNVYQNPHGRPFFKLVVGVDDEQLRRKWNCVIMLHIDAKGRVVGSSNSPFNYVKEHHDLVGIVKNMPDLKVEWLRKEEKDHD